jgi:anaerobic magnesium-protoporphyrin IX monomethyl ester cyclase
MERRFTRALLINPPTGLYRRDDRCQCKVEDQTIQIIFPPIELAEIAAVLRRAGAEVRIEDYPAARGTWERYLNDLRSWRPDLVLVNVVTATAAQDFTALAEAKNILGADRVITAAKGEYMDAHGEAALAENPQVDFGFHGEIDQVLEQFQLGRPLEELPGLIWRKSSSNGVLENIVRNPGHPLLEDLDSLPFPARDLLDNALYRSPETGNPLTIIHGNRGCPSKCIFCPAGLISNYKVRYRSPERIMAEIDECVTRHGLREFLFHGDTFTLKKEWLLELCDRIIASGHKIHWGCNSRVDTMDDERATCMRQAGCWVVAFGIESGNQDILDRMKKGQRLERAEQAVAACKRHGLRTHAFFVIGTPWETEQTLKDTHEFARRLGTDFFDFNIAYPLPGTELHEIVSREGLFEAPREGTGYADAAVRTHALSSARLTQWRRRTLLAMYLRPSYIARMLTRAGSPRVMFNYIRAGVRRLRQLLS